MDMISIFSTSMIDPFMSHHSQTINNIVALMSKPTIRYYDGAFLDIKSETEKQRICGAVRKSFKD
jgi:hypothetical protein